MEDVHRAGGVMALLGELQRAGLLNDDGYHIAGDSLIDVLKEWDIKQTDNLQVKNFFRAAPSGKKNIEAFSHEDATPGLNPKLLASRSTCPSKCNR